MLLHSIGFNTVSVYTRYSTRSAAGTLANSPANHTARGVEFILIWGCSQDKWAVFKMHPIRTLMLVNMAACWSEIGTWIKDI